MDRSALAAALVAARRRLKPADVGLVHGGRRRVVGLRREEVALLAGISVDYLVRLEQGRGPVPSTPVVGALARALRLGDDERAHLFLVAGADPPRPGRIDHVVRPSTLRLIDRLADLPVLVLDAKRDLIGWNPMALALLGDLTAVAPEERNLLRFQFLGDGPGRLDPSEDRDRLAVESVQDLRLAAARYPDDPGLQRLLADLRAGSPRFVELWDEGRVAARRVSRKAFVHPDVGPLTLDCDVLNLPDADQQLVVYSAAEGSDAAAALAVLRVVGLQTMGSPSEVSG